MSASRRPCRFAPSAEAAAPRRALRSPQRAGHTGTHTALQTRASGLCSGDGYAELLRGPCGADHRCPPQRLHSRSSPTFLDAGGAHPRGGSSHSVAPSHLVEKSQFQNAAGALPSGSPALRLGVGVVLRRRPLPRPTASQRLSRSSREVGRHHLANCACARMRRTYRRSSLVSPSLPQRLLPPPSPNLLSVAPTLRAARVTQSAQRGGSSLEFGSRGGGGGGGGSSVGGSSLLGGGGGGPGPELRSPPLPTVLRHLPERPDLLWRRGEHAAPFPEAGE